MKTKIKKNLFLFLLFPSLSFAQTKVALPRYLIWSKSIYGNSASYFLEIEKDGKIFLQKLVEKNEFLFDPKQEGNYTWRVKACPDLCDDPNCIKIQCTDWFAQESFYGCVLDPPRKIMTVEKEGADYEPQTETMFLPEEEIKLKIKEPIKCENKEVFYQFELEGPIDENCKEKKILLPEVNKATTSREIDLKEYKKAILKENSEEKKVFCLGSYRWRVRGCIDTYCNEAGEWGPVLTFYVVKTKSKNEWLSRGGGGLGLGTCSDLIPCKGRQCELQDVLKLLANIINCITWTLAPLAILFAFVYTGILFFTQSQNPEVFSQIKTVWKNVGGGWLLIFFAWTFLNLFFKIIGWRKEILGDWFNPLK